MTALKQLVRLHRWSLDEKRQKLAELERLADRLRADVKALDDSLEAEKAPARQSVEGAAAYSRFAAAMAERRGVFERSIADVESQAEAARAEVQAAFQEYKTYELGLKNHERREAQKRARREQAALDDVGLGIGNRRRHAK